MAIKIVGPLEPAHDRELRREVDEVIEEYVLKCADHMVRSWEINMCDDRTTIEVFSMSGDMEAILEIDMQALLNKKIRIYADRLWDSECALDEVKIWYDFFNESAAGLKMFLKPEDL